MLAGLARQVAEFIGASACLISIVDAERGVVRDRAGYARPPHRWKRTSREHLIADFPRTPRCSSTGDPYTCTAKRRRPRRDAAAARARLPLADDAAMQVDGEPFALVEVFDERRRAFTPDEVRLCQALTNESGAMVARARMSERIEAAYFATLGALAAALEAKDAYTNGHASQIAELAGAACDQLGIPPGRARIVAWARCCTTSARSASPRRSCASPGR